MQFDANSACEALRPLVPDELDAVGGMTACILRSADVYDVSVSYRGTI